MSFYPAWAGKRKRTPYKGGLRRFVKKIAYAEQGLKQFADENMMNYLQENGFMNDPMLTRLFSKIGESLTEDTIINNGESKYGLTPEELRNKIRSYYAKDHPFMIPGHPERQFYMDEMRKMLVQLEGDDAASNSATGLTFTA